MRFYNMSVENLKQYGKLCAENEEIRKKAKEIGLQDLDGQIAHGKSLGLEFSREDFDELGKEAGLDSKNELSEEDLKKVAGGAATISTVLILVALMAGSSAVASGAGVATILTMPGW
jgi:predicted ribosomally synthesized peptide with nif11-like leader